MTLKNLIFTKVNNFLDLCVILFNKKNDTQLMIIAYFNFKKLKPFTNLLIDGMEIHKMSKRKKNLKRE